MALYCTCQLRYVQEEILVIMIIMKASADATKAAMAGTKAGGRLYIGNTRYEGKNSEGTERVASLQFYLSLVPPL